MFINAEPRSVSNGFETFVPSQRAESLHQRLVEMTNNDVNAWSVYRPANRSAADAWDQHFDDFGNNENFPVNHSSEGNMAIELIHLAGSRLIRRILPKLCPKFSKSSHRLAEDCLVRGCTSRASSS